MWGSNYTLSIDLNNTMTKANTTTFSDTTTKKTTDLDDENQSMASVEISKTYDAILYAKTQLEERHTKKHWLHMAKGGNSPDILYLVVVWVLRQRVDMEQQENGR